MSIRLRQLGTAKESLERSSFIPSDSGKYYLLIGALQFERYQFEESFSALARAQYLLEAQSELEYLGHTYLYLGRLFKDGFSNPNQARFFYKKALAIYQQLLNGEQYNAAVNFQIARTYPFSDLEKRSYYNQLAMDFYSRSPVQNYLELAECLNLQALILYYQEKNSKTWKEKFSQGIKLVESSGLNSRINLGKYYDNLGFCLSVVNDQKALYYLELGLKINRSIEFNEYWVTSSLNNIGSYYEKQGEVNRSTLLYKEVLSLRRKLYGDRNPEVALACQHVAVSFQKLGMVDSALVYFQKAKNIFASYKPDRLLGQLSPFDLSYAFVLKDQATAWRSKHEATGIRSFLDSAFVSIEAACSLVNGTYNSIEQENSKLVYAQQIHELFTDAIEIGHGLFELTNSDRYLFSALNAMEALRYASAYETQIQVRNSYARDSNQQLFQKYLSLKAELAVTEASGSHAVHESKIQKLSGELFAISDSLRLNDPRISYTESNAEDILKRRISPDAGEVILEYHDTGNFLYIIGISSSKKLFKKLIKPADWDRNFDEFISLISNIPAISTFDQDQQKFVRLSLFFYQQFIAPVEEAVIDAQKVLIVPDIAFNDFPFELLVKEASDSQSYQQLNYLFRQFNIERLLSLKFQPAVTKLSLKKILAFGFTEGHFSIRGAAKEIEQIGKNFEVEKRIGTESSSEYFLQHSGDYPLVHLAVHGQADRQNRLKSRLIFSESDTLFSYQLYALRLNSPLIILSSCESGLGKHQAGEGIFSLARAFVMAGASSLVVTLWKAPDHSSAKIFSEFYTRLGRGGSSARIIQEAKLEYLSAADKYNAHPYYWAGIVPLGTVEVGEPKFASRFVLLATVTICSFVFILAFWFSKKRAS